jgi:hypothetical protein
MRKLIRIAGAATALVATSLAPMPASASSIIMVSSVYGNNSTCVAGDPTKPCFSFFKAVELASPGDMIYLDAGSYFNANITKTLNIFSRHGATFFGGESPCLRINAGPNDVVNIDGINCVLANDGNHGIEFNSGEKLRVRNSTFRGGASGGCGIQFQPNSNAELFVERSIVSETGTTGGAGGICVLPASGVEVVGVIDNTTIENTRYGLRGVSDSTSAVRLLINNSTFSGNGTAIRSTGANSVLRMSNSSVYQNNNGLTVASAGQLISVGGNVVVGNTPNGTFTSTEAKK